MGLAVDEGGFVGWKSSYVGDRSLLGRRGGGLGVLIGTVSRVQDDAEGGLVGEIGLVGVGSDPFLGSDPHSSTISVEE